MNRGWLRALLGLIALLMLADFVFRGIAPALGPGKNDFSEVYVGAWMWRHEQNFYDAPLATAIGDSLGNTRVNIVLIYPPTALVLIAPLTFLPWKLANLLWLLIGLAGIAVTIALLIRLSGLRMWEDRALLLATFVLAFDPLHQAFHQGNVALVAVPLCFLGVFFAEDNRDWAAGVTLGIAAALKPQLGIWFLAFYFLQLRKRVFVGSLLPAAALALAFVRYPVPAETLISSYRSNLLYWFGPGRLYGFTEGALPFHVNNTQVIFFQLLHNIGAANFLAYGLFVCGLMVWIVAVWRARFRVSAPLPIASLTALSFVALYHSVSDATILTLALCWAIGDRERPQHARWARCATSVIFLLLMLPGHSVLMRVTPHLALWVTDSWEWKLLIARYFVWLLAALNIVLLLALIESSHSTRNLDSSLRSPAPQELQ
jgi:hypothetical protein